MYRFHRIQAKRIFKNIFPTGPEWWHSGKALHASDLERSPASRHPSHMVHQARSDIWAHHQETRSATGCSPKFKKIPVFIALNSVYSTTNDAIYILPVEDYQHLHSSSLRYWLTALLRNDISKDLFGGHTWWWSGLTLGSDLRYHSWGRPHWNWAEWAVAKQAPYLLSLDLRGQQAVVLLHYSRLIPARAELVYPVYPCCPVNTLIIWLAASGL